MNKFNFHSLPIKNPSTKRTIPIILGALLLSGFTSLYVNSIVNADQYDEQIRALQRENAAYNSKANELKIYANSLAEELAKLDAEKAELQIQIDASTAKLEELKIEISLTEKKIDETREALGYVISEIYLAGQITPIERLAGSKDFSQYLDEEAARETVQSGLSKSVKDINLYKNQLETQKKEFEQVIEDQKTQRAALVTAEHAKQSIFSQTKGQEASYLKLKKANNDKISQLEAQQAEEMRRAAQQGGWNVPTGTVGGGGYPGTWSYARKDSIVDSWGLYNRECVSYAAWKVSSTGRFVPHFGGYGNANQWPGTTSRHGIANGFTAKEGSVAVWYIGTYGHVMYVEKVNGDGTMWVSDYNWNGDGAYHYYQRSTAGLTYIYF